MWNVLSGLSWWVYALCGLWYLSGVWATGAMFSVRLWDLESYESAAGWFWVIALGGWLVLLAVAFNGDLGRGCTVPGPWARRHAERIHRAFEEYHQMVFKDPALPTKYRLRHWREIWEREKFSFSP